MAITQRIPQSPVPDPRRRAAHARVLAPGALLALGLLLLASACGKKNPTVPTPIPPLDSIRVLPDTLRVRVGQTAAFSVIGWDTAGTVVNGVPASFTTDDTLDILLLGTNGTLRGLSEGTARVFARWDTLLDSAVVVVLPQADGWFTQTSNAAGVALHGVFFLPDARRGWAVGDGGKILATVDGGSRWSTLNSGQTVALRAVWFTSATQGFAVGASGTILRTANGGTSWTRQTSNASESLEDVCFVNDSTGWVVGGSGVVLKTTNRGLTWTRRIVTTSPDLYGVSFAGPLDGWAVGSLGAIAGTHDGGTSWFVVQPSITSVDLRAVWRRSEAVAFAAGALGAVPRTVRPDTTRWELRTTAGSDQLEGVHFPSDLIGYAVGQRSVGLVLRTDDAGQIWRTQNANTQFRLNDVFFVDERQGWAVGANGTILHTGTGGE